MYLYNTVVTAARMLVVLDVDVDVDVDALFVVLVVVLTRHIWTIRIFVNVPFFVVVVVVVDTVVVLSFLLFVLAGRDSLWLLFVSFLSTVSSIS